jgi:hypothetical protein
MSILIDQYSTKYINKYNKVFIGTCKNRRALFMENYYCYEFIDFISPNVIQDMVVNKGFLMDSQSSDKLVFTHPHNTPENKTYFNLWTKTNEVEKITYEFLNFI